MEGLLLVISGPSGVGKGTICNELLKRLPIVPSISVTTRPPRGHETDGVEYFFATDEQFDDMIKNDMLLEYADVFGHRYGTPKKHIDEMVSRGDCVMLEIDVNGARQIKSKYPSCVAVFIMPPSFEVLEKRLRGRGTDSEASIVNRLSKAKLELSSYKLFDYIVFNDSLERAIDDAVSIVKAERAKTMRNQKEIEKLLEKGDK